MKIKLNSDYLDYYDFFFDLDGKEFYRRAAKPNGYSKPQQFDLLSSYFGYKVPPNATVREFYAQSVRTAKCYNPAYNSSEQLVVYLDNYAHAGNDKIVWSIAGSMVELENGPNLYASLFLPTTEDPLNHSISYKYIKFGMHYALFKIECFNGWRTNSGNLDIVLIKHGLEEDLQKLIWNPLYSIDMIRYNGEYYAVDLNTAPGMRGLGMHHEYAGQEIVDSIRRWFELYA